MARALNKEFIQADLTASCCSNSCTEKCRQKLSGTANAIDMIFRWRQEYHSLKQGPQQQTLLAKMIRSTLTKLKGQRPWYHNVEGIHLCRLKYFHVILCI
jgi:formate dehydrogenase assembly factor FdhD